MLSTTATDVPLVRSASTLRIFQNTTRKLVHFGPSGPDSTSLLLHCVFTFASFLLLVSFLCFRDQNGALNVKHLWTALKKRFDQSTPLMICLLLNIWLIGFAVISLVLYYRYERDTEVRYADDVIMVDKDIDQVIPSNDNSVSNKNGVGLFNSKLEGIKITVIGLPKSTSNGLEGGRSSTLAIGLSNN